MRTYHKEPYGYAKDPEGDFYVYPTPFGGGYGGRKLVRIERVHLKQGTRMVAKLEDGLEECWDELDHVWLRVVSARLQTLTTAYRSGPWRPRHRRATPRPRRRPNGPRQHRQHTASPGPRPLERNPRIIARRRSGRRRREQTRGESSLRRRSRGNTVSRPSVLDAVADVLSCRRRAVSRQGRRYG